MTRLNQIQRVINQRNILKKALLSKSLANQGLYEQALLLQKPMIDTIAKSSENTNKELELVKRAIETTSSNQPQQALLTQTSHNPTITEPITPEDEEIINIIKNAPRFRNENQNTLRLVRKIDDNPLYTLGSKIENRLHFTLIDTILIDDMGHKYRIPSAGVAKLLFENRPTPDNITADDVTEYRTFLNSYGYTNIINAAKNDIIDGFFPNQKTPRKSTKKPKIEEVDSPTAIQGEGMVVKEKKREPQVITIPSDPDELRRALLLQLSAAKAGNTGNFNSTNAIMKELLKQKLLKGKDYRDILKVYFHV